MAGWTFNTGDDDPPSIGPQITAIAIVFTTLSLIFVSLRMYVRCFMIKATGADDWISVVSWFCSCGFAVVTIIQTRWGLGLHDPEALPNENKYTFGLLQFIGAPFYISSILGFKLALLVSYLRILPHGLWRNLTIGTIVGCTLFHLSFLITQVNLCTPVRFQWDGSVEGGRCLVGPTVYIPMAAVTIFFDVLVMALPFPVLATLQVPTRKKAILLGLLALGLFITIIQIIRIQTIKSLVNLTDSAMLIMWSTVENNLGLIVACVPTLSPLIKYFNENTRKSKSNSRGQSNVTPGSRYAMQTWGSTNRGVPLGSGVDIQRGKDRSDADSTDSILGETGLVGIVRKTEVTITTQGVEPMPQPWEQK